MNRHSDAEVIEHARRIQTDLDTKAIPTTIPGWRLHILRDALIRLHSADRARDHETSVRDSLGDGPWATMVDSRITHNIDQFLLIYALLLVERWCPAAEATSAAEMMAAYCEAGDSTGEAIWDWYVAAMDDLPLALPHDDRRRRSNG